MLVRIMLAKSTFELVSWEEELLADIPTEQPVAKASAWYKALQEITGSFKADYLLHYSQYNQENPHLSEATYLGYLFFEGVLKGRKGTFVLEERGTFEKGLPHNELVIKENTGTEELSGIQGTGKYFLDGDNLVIEIDYGIEK